MMNHQSLVIIHQSSIISQSSIRDQLGIIWTSSGDHLEVILGSFGRHLGIIWDHLGVIWDHLGIIWGSFGDHLGTLWIKKTKMVDETGRNRSKIGNFDTGRCASISGPRKSRFWPTIPIFFKKSGLFP